MATVARLLCDHVTVLSPTSSPVAAAIATIVCERLQVRTELNHGLRPFHLD
jgi:hypothetical protein